MIGMKLSDLQPDIRQKYFEILDISAKASGGAYRWSKILDLGVKRIRLVSYSKEFEPHIYKQLDYVLTEDDGNWDETLVMWKYNSEFSLGMQDFERVYDHKDSYIWFDRNNGLIFGYNDKTNTHYYGVENLEPEEFIKQGHIFIQFLFDMLKAENTAVIHGALVGLNDNGILLCAGGGMGKSTLSVCAMLDGFDYVSDDYLILEKTEEGLFARPIYSIVTLSPRMYSELYYDLDSKFVSNNARKNKYVLNISKYYERFSRKYPVKLIMYPNISDCKTPSVEACDKGKCVVQLVQSTIQQMQNRHDVETVKKLTNFVKDFDSYQINLSDDIWANEKCLKEFMEQNYTKKERENEKQWAVIN